MSMTKAFSTIVAAAFSALCSYSLSSCGIFEGTSGEVIQTLLSSPDTEVKTPSQRSDNKKYGVDVEKQMKEADKERKRQESQPLKKH